MVVSQGTKIKQNIIMMIINDIYRWVSGGGGAV
jgi:hypothetical protein